LAGLIIFVKNPELGKCKTRLAATIGDEKALLVYKKLLEHTKNVSLQLSLNKYLFYDQKIETSDNWANDKFRKNIQHSGDLGDRMYNAFKTVLQSETKAVIIGSDCPEISSEIINQAVEALDKKDFVIGPTFDGGYYLLGMKTASKYIFENMSWSIDSVFDETISRINKHNKTYSLLETLSDLDYEEDLNKFPTFKA